MPKIPDKTFYNFKYVGKMSEYRFSATCYFLIKAISATVVKKIETFVS